jgi:hypothetical protein
MSLEIFKKTLGEKATLKGVKAKYKYQRKKDKKPELYGYTTKSFNELQKMLNIVSNL